MVGPASALLKITYSVSKVNRDLRFSVKGYFSYFFWKNTHPCNNLTTVSTKLLQPEHWGMLKPPISFAHLFKQSLLISRTLYLGYRLKTRALPFLKTHIWLHYLYPLTTMAGFYPSFMEPTGLISFDTGGGAAFVALAYRLARALRWVLFKTIW